MAEPSGFDPAAAHRYFAAYCFNAAWDLIEKEGRSARDDEMMVALSQASIFHWSQRPDCTDRNLSIGYWQASRVQSLIGNAAEALRLGEICLGYSQGLPPYLVAYAHEALARAHRQMAQPDQAAAHLAAARDQLPLIKTQEDRDRLAADLDEIG
jgi:hypothetical protein